MAKKKKEKVEEKVEGVVADAGEAERQAHIARKLEKRLLKKKERLEKTGRYAESNKEPKVAEEVRDEEPKEEVKE